MAKDCLNFGLSGKISPNLVTLASVRVINLAKADAQTNEGQGSKK